MRILIVDDDVNISEILEIALSQEGYDIISVNDSIKAKKFITTMVFDMIIMDIMMPNMNGFDLCQYTREYSDAPIIFITCLDDEQSLVKALTLGGDDFIKKPFSLSEVIARVSVHARRIEKNLRLMNSANTGAKINDVEYIGEGYAFYPNKKLVLRAEERIHLSPLECDMLVYFLTRKGDVLSYKMIYEAIWKEPYIMDKSTIMVRVSNLRNKLPDLAIDTIRGKGYCLSC